METRKLFLGILAALAIASCSSEESITADSGGNSEVSDGDSRFLTVNIVSNGAGGTRADDNYGQQYTNSDNTYEYGLESENKVYNARFYFFDKDNAPVNVKIDGGKAVNYVDCTPSSDAGTTFNVERNLAATVVLETYQGQTLPQKMVAVLNAKGKALNFSEKSDTTLDASLSLSDLQAILASGGKYFTTNEGTNYFVMSSSVYLNNSTVQCPAAITSTGDNANLQKSKSKANENAVTVYVERMAAKVRVNIAMDNLTATNGAYLARVSGSGHGENNATYDNWTYIPSAGGDEQNIYVKFKKWGLTNTAQNSYLFKSISTDWGTTSPCDNWNDATNYRCYWALNPSTTTLENNNITVSSGAMGLEGTFYTAPNNSNYSSVNNDGETKYLQYCLENAADKSDGSKSDYDADKELSNRTQVVIEAELCNSDGKALTLAQWQGLVYEVNDWDDANWGTKNDNKVKTMMLEQANVALSNNTTCSGVTLKADDVVFVNGEDAVSTTGSGTMADKTSQNSKRYLTYIQVKSDYTASTTSNTPTNAQINAVLSGVAPCKVWNKGVTYFYTDLKHGTITTTTSSGGDGSNSTPNVKDLYGVVRNHIYDVVINNFFGLGTPVAVSSDTKNNNNYIIPQKTQEEYWYLSAKINILSWRLQKYNTTLDW